MRTDENIIYIKHILDAIHDIEESITGLTRLEFKKSKDKRDATIRRLEIIGEATKNISEDIKKKYPNVEWRKIAGTRDIIIHAYFSVDIDIIWDIIKKDLPILKSQIILINTWMLQKNK